MCGAVHVYCEPHRAAITCADACSVLCVRVSEGRLAFLTLVCLLHSQACFFQGGAGTASAEASAAKQPGLGVVEEARA